MRIILALVFSGFACSSSLAVERIRADQNTCAAVQNFVSQRGAAIVQYPSTRVANYLLYDRYVSDARFCRFGQRIKFATVPTVDRQCRLYLCADFEPLFEECDDFTIGGRSLFCLR